jgi:subtilisin family serine protease
LQPRKHPGKSPGPNHTYVIPDDAAPLIGAGSLDIELFDITELMTSHFDDQSRDSLPLIATYDQSQVRALSASTFSANGVSVARQLQPVHAVALRASKKTLGGFWQSWAKGSREGVKKLWLDRVLQPVLDQSVPQIGAPAAWSAGYEGDGVTVAVIDSGVDATHPDLNGKILIENNFTTETGGDKFGHGTHVASIIAGTGAASSGKYRGVAPHAQLISAKVCTTKGCFTSDVVAGMQWAVAEQGAKIVNMSIGGLDYEGVDPLESAINTLSAQYGTLFVVAAGNDGPNAKTMGSPGTTDAALAVGAVNRMDQIAPFSSRGPRLDGALKPDITAPGVGIVAARAAGTSIGSPVGASYVAASGTSMAAPHVAGAAALLSQLHPEWTGEQLKAVLMGSAKANPALSVLDQGAGRVDVAAAFQATVLASPASLSLGTALYPHEDDAPITRSVTYQNSGATPVTLQLSVAALTPDGTAAPSGMFTASPATLTLAPGESGTASITANTQLGSKNGWYGGRIIAAGADQTIVTPFSVLREVESYNVTLKHLDQNGQDTFYFFNYIYSLENRDGFYGTFFQPGPVTKRLPKGRYLIHTTFAFDLDAMVVMPEYAVSGDASITMDRRDAKPIKAVGPSATSHSPFNHLGYVIPTPFGGVGVDEPAYILSGWEDNEDPVRNIGVIGAPPANATSYWSVQWFDLGAEGVSNPPMYAATWLAHGAFLTNPEYRIDTTRLATVQAKYHSAFPELNEGYLFSAPKTPSVFGWYGPSWVTPLPTERTEYFYSNESIPWISRLSSGPDTVFLLETYPVVRKPNTEVTTTWNDPPYGPAQVQATRTGNRLQLTAPLFGDWTGHQGAIEDTTHLDLYRNGEKLDGVDSHTVGTNVDPALATYRLEVTGNQKLFGLSSQVQGSWTFDSQRIDDTTLVSLPLISARFRPQLNAQGQAIRGTVLPVPVWLEQFGKQGPVTVRNLTVEASFDDGLTWTAVPLRCDREIWTASIRSPSNAQYVSLRARIDAGSASSEQTIIRAYGLIDAAPVK